MTGESFRNILESAIAGDTAALEQILQIYRKLLTRESTVNGELNEDLLQQIYLEIALSISGFQI